ncbi:MAG TPA: hypothetical protein VF748_06135 [Candidatus Acidoferrum sp.]
MNSLLIDPDILIEVSRRRHAVIPAQWSQLGLSKLPLFLLASHHRGNLAWRTPV